MGRKRVSAAVRAVKKKRQYVASRQNVIVGDETETGVTAVDSAMKQCDTVVAEDTGVGEVDSALMQEVETR